MDAAGVAFRDLASRVQQHADQIREVDMQLARLDERVDELKASTATRGQLEHAVELLKVKLDGLRADLDPIRKGITSLVMLVLGAIIVGGITGLVLYIKR